MLAQWMVAGQSLEGLMIVCFGAAWPAAIWKTWRAKRTEGKSLIFLALVLLGYMAGVVSKFLRVWGTGGSPEPIWMLYALNVVLVTTDLALVLKYRRATAGALAHPSREHRDSGDPEDSRP